MNPGIEGNENAHHSEIQHKQTNPQLHCDGLVDISRETKHKENKLCQEPEML